MSFIRSKTDTKYVDAYGISCLDVFITTNTILLEEGFTANELPSLREQLQNVIDDIDYLLGNDEQP